MSANAPLRVILGHRHAAYNSRPARRRLEPDAQSARAYFLCVSRNENRAVLDVF
jgi:hypothetical protein